MRITKADYDGRFVFIDAVGPGFLEATSIGFLTVSTRVPDNPTEQVLLTLQIGICNQCTTVRLVDIRDRSVRYEDKAGRQQLTGTVGEFSGPLLAHVSLRLMKADLNAPEATPLSSTHSPSMNERVFQYALAAQTTANEKGEFQFASIEPGWYSLDASHDGYFYEQEIRKFWIARETLTRPSRIEMVRQGGASPMRPPEEFPLTPARQ